MKISLLVIFCFLGSYSIAQTQADSIANFIIKNKKKCALYIIKDNAQILAHQENNTVPIATLSDLLVAIEFAKQSTYKVIDSGEKIPLKEVVRYDIAEKVLPEYENWLTYLLVSKKVQDVNTSVSYADIANGMLQYGVQPCTELLIEKIGYDNVKSSIVSYNLTGHSTIALPIGSLALYQNRKGVTEKKVLQAVNDLDDDGYAAASYVMHLAIKGDSLFKNKIPKDFGNAKTMITWSNNLPQGSLKSYGNLLQSIIKEKMLDARFYRTLRPILEWKMNDKNIATIFDRYMQKTSTTINTYTNALFSKSKVGKEQVMVYTFFDLSPSDKAMISRCATSFDDKLANDIAFVKKIQSGLSVKSKK
jgi:D-alanyl-D-alanine carboxypeptidase